MTRIDTQTLAIHLEVALTCAAPETLEQLQDSDNLSKRRATFNLALHLADRVGCFEIRGQGLETQQDEQQPLFQDDDGR